MAKTQIPDPLNRRHLVMREISQAQALRYADAYLAAGRTLEAVDFLIKADAEEKLLEVRQEAIESGDAFLLRVVSEATGAQTRPDEWEVLARQAESHGKQRYAAEARRNAQVRGE